MSSELAERFFAALRMTVGCAQNDSGLKGNSYYKQRIGGEILRCAQNDSGWRSE
jgi:hypothetical protein